MRSLSRRFQEVRTEVDYVYTGKLIDSPMSYYTWTPQWEAPSRRSRQFQLSSL